MPSVIKPFTFPKLDAAENFFFAKELEHRRPNSYDVEYAKLRIRELVPVDHSVPEGAETDTYEQYDGVGVSKLIANYADDLPRVDVKGKEFTTRIYGGGDSYAYSVADIRAAREAGKRLDAKRAEWAREANEQLIQKLGALGDANRGIVGFLGIPNAQTYTVPAGISGDTEFLLKTPDEILRDLNAIVIQIVETTKEVEKPDTLLLPTRQHGHISTTPRSSASDTTILQFFLKNNPWIKSVESWEQLKGAGAGGTDRMVAYHRNPSRLVLSIPMEHREHPPEARNLSFIINTEFRIGGVKCFRPMSVCYGDGI